MGAGYGEEERTHLDVIKRCAKRNAAGRVVQVRFRVFTSTPVAKVK